MVKPGYISVLRLSVVWSDSDWGYAPRGLTLVVPLITNYARPAAQDLALTPFFTDGELPLD